MTIIGLKTSLEYLTIFLLLAGKAFDKKKLKAFDKYEL